MAKYRLSYLKYGGFKSINLNGLECLKDFDTTDLSVIDKFTTNFQDMNELLEFLKRNGLIENNITGLAITIDKKEDGKVVNKKIYNGEKILFKSDYKYLSVSFIYKWLSSNRYNLDKIIKICDNYIEKYHNAYNRIDGSSYILSIFNGLRRLAYGYKNNSIEITNSVHLEYNKLIDDFMTIEFFKVDKDKLKNGEIIRKRNDDGTCPKQYRNIHDFVILMKKIDKDLDLYKSDKLIDENNVVIKNNNESVSKISENFAIDYEHEEYLEETDFDGVLNNVQEKFEPYQDGHDYIVPTSKMNKSDIRRLTLQPGDGYRK